MPTIHWFFSEGTTRSLANYVLMQPLAERLRPVFPRARSWDGGQGRPPVVTANSPTPGLLHLLGPLAENWELRFHPVVTQEVLCDPAKAGKNHLKEQLSELPEKLAPSEEAYLAASKQLDQRDPDGMSELIRWMLSVDIGDDDAVFIESSGGLRPFQTALTLGAALLHAVHPSIRTITTAYAELGGRWVDRTVVARTDRLPGAGNTIRELASSPKLEDRERVQAGERPFSPINDLTAMLQLPAWAAAATGLQRRLDLTALADLATTGLTEAPKVAESIRKVQHSLDLAWPDDLDREWVALDAALQGAAANLQQDPAQAAVIDLLQRTLNELTGDSAARQPAVLNLARVELHLRFAERLVAARRFGAALRVLREVMVSREVLAGLGRPSAETAAEVSDHKRRTAAEVRLNRSAAHHALWKELSDLRNTVAHVNQARGSGDASLQKVVQAFSPQAEAGLVARVRAAVTDPSAWIRKGSEDKGQVALCVAVGPQASAPKEALRRQIEAAISAAEAGLTDRRQPPPATLKLPVEAEGTTPADLKVFTMAAKHSQDVPAKGTAKSKVEPVLQGTSARHAIFCGAWPPTAQLAYLRALEARGLLCWVLDEDQQQLHALFDRGVLEWMRDLPAGG